MVRRDVLEKLRWLPLERVELMVALSEKGYDWVDLQCRVRRGRPHIDMRTTRDALTSDASLAATRTVSRHPKRPNYLDRLKRFALGE